MSLTTELSEDRRYVLNVKKTDDPSEKELEDAAVAILRKVIAPTFRQMHYDGSYRTEKHLEILVDFSEEKSFTITPKPAWNFSHRGVDYSKKCYYHQHVELFPKGKLWTKISLMGHKPEWEMGANYALMHEHQLIFYVNLED